MAYVSCGKLLYHIVQKGRLPEDEARKFIQQIFAGVEYYHRNIVAHRQVDSKGNVKIADPGISGKLYAEPEVDVWSCGLLLYALLCRTFHSTMIPNLFKKIKNNHSRIYLGKGTPTVVKYEVQHFRTSEGKYVLDLQNPQGPEFLFMDLCSALFGAYEGVRLRRKKNIILDHFPCK